MAYYYIISFYLTGVFIVSYFLVQVLLAGFDALNFFWDYWDEKKWVHPNIGYFEFLILAGVVYYIVRWELSGTP